MFTNNIIELIENNFYLEVLSNKNFLEKLRDVVIKELSLKGYLTKITTANLSKYNAVALLGETEIYLDKNMVIENLKLLEISSSPRTITYEYYASILHEIIHVIRQRDFEKRKDLRTHNKCIIHSELVRKGNISLSPNNPPSIKDKLAAKKLYEKSGILFPIEREAEIISRQTALEIFDKVYEEYLKEREELRELYSDVLLNYYDLPTCPLEAFYKLIKREDIFKSLSFDGYSTHEKCIYGMPLTEEEYISEIEKSLKLTK